MKKENFKEEEKGLDVEKVNDENIELKETDLEIEYKRNYERYKNDIDRQYVSNTESFYRMQDDEIKATIFGWRQGIWGNDPRTADAILYELNKRGFTKHENDFKEYLNKTNYKKPWLKR